MEAVGSCSRLRPPVHPHTQFWWGRWHLGALFLSFPIYEMELTSRFSDSCSPPAEQKLYRCHRAPEATDLHAS